MSKINFEHYLHTTICLCQPCLISPDFTYAPMLSIIYIYVSPIKCRNSPLKEAFRRC